MGLFSRKPNKLHNHVDVDIERKSAEVVGRLNQLADELEFLLVQVEDVSSFGDSEDE